MRSRKEGDWYTTTPLYVGTNKDIAKMDSCQHEIWVDTQKVIENGYLLILQRCTRCNATRSRYKCLGEDTHQSVNN